MKISVKWDTGMRFEASNEANSVVTVLDTVEKLGGTNNGQTPKQMFLQSIAGCTGMDVVYILKRMRAIEPETFQMEVEGTQSETKPTVFTDIVLDYHITGNTDKEKLLKAITLSQENYCGVSAMVKMAANFHYRVFFNGELIHEG